MKTDFNRLFSDEYFSTIDDKLSIIEELKLEPNPPHWNNTSLDDIDGEKWADIEIPGFRKLYQISNYQRVKSVARELVDRRTTRFIKEKILKQNYGLGYRQICLSNHRRLKPTKIHILMAMCFVLNKNHKVYNRVNHINGDRNDNRPKNLEWVTKRQDVIHRYYVLKKIDKRNRKGYNSKCSTAVLQFDKYGTFIKELGSQGDICRELGFSQADISRACNRQRAISHGFIWKFKNNREAI